MKNQSSPFKIFLIEIVVFIVSSLALVYSLNHFLNENLRASQVLIDVVALANAGLLIYGIWQSVKQKQPIWAILFTLGLAALGVCWFYMMAALTLSEAFRVFSFS